MANAGAVYQFDEPCLFTIVSNDECINSLKQLLRATGIYTDIIGFSTAGDAAAYLSECMEGDGKSPRPRIVFIDLQALEITGVTLLWWIRAQPALDGTAVIAMSSCKEACDIAPERRLGSDCYLYKFPSSAMLRQVCLLGLEKRRASRAPQHQFRSPKAALYY